MDKSEPSPERIEALKKNIAMVWDESIAVTGLPIDILLGHVLENASRRGLKASGRMINFGGGPSFVPEKDDLKIWLDTWFDQLKAMSEPVDQNDMPEA